MSDLASIAKLAGVETHYRDAWGGTCQASEEALAAILAALGLPVDTPEAREESFHRLTAERETLLPPVIVVDAQRAMALRFAHHATYRLQDEKNNLVHEGKMLRGVLPLPPLAMGYYRLQVEMRDQQLESFIIAAPPQCWQPRILEEGNRIWGVATQLYGVRSSHDWGMGDFSDLALLAKKTAKLGVDVVGLNPVHAAFPANPAHSAPYSPSNRLLVNPLYLDPEAIEGFGEPAIQAVWKSQDFQQRWQEAKQASLVDYAKVAACKWPILELLFKHFEQQADKTRYHEFCDAQEDILTHQALFDTLSETYSTNWHSWPEALQQPNSPAVENILNTHAARVAFYKWLYWQADKQLGNAQAAALKQGMAIGLYRDLAVGPERSSAEYWRDPQAFVPGCAVGAPPDLYNPAGQNWGLPAFNYRYLRKQGYAPFLALLRANMRHARALRIDHAFGLSRLFLIPDGVAGGTYVQNPFTELLAILRVESHRNQCLVIGEDLGVFPENYKETAANSGLFSYKVLYFEREDEKGFAAPEQYPPRALATVSTHDLPTISGWYKAADIDERAKLGLYPKTELEQKDRASRPKEIAQLEEAFARENLTQGSPHTKAAEYLSRSAASIVMVQLEDILEVESQANLPGTTDQRPNWRMRLPSNLETILAADGPLALLAPILNQARARPLMTIPRATYRLQFHKDFTFADATAIIPYLAQLGISHVYASPFLKARPGSTHGYDITDHNQFNPELGGEAGYRNFCDVLEAQGLKQILDFVPNHMGVGGADNQWWLSVLEWGEASPQAGYFDIDWLPRYAGATVKLVLPVLGSAYGDVLAAYELKLVFTPETGTFHVTYFNHHFPICPRDYHIIFETITEVQTFADGEALKQTLAQNKPLHAAIEQAVEAINTDKERMHALLERQHYRLAFWRVASTDINYRRFFDINDLAGLRPENSELFDVMHKLVLHEIAQGRIQGLRIDHIDGLADPAGYCRRLREKAGSGLYLTIEKILGRNETLPKDWGIQGTSGYDALNIINGLFVEPQNEKRFTRIYQQFTGLHEKFDTLVIRAKRLVLDTSLASELERLSIVLKRIADHNRYSRDYPHDTLKQALAEIISYFPVYRSYATAESVTDEDRRMIQWAIGRAKKASSLPDRSIYDFIASLLTLEEIDPSPAKLAFTRKFQQLSGPVMAKGLEDTSFYRYNRLLSLNEVGGDPSRFGLSIKAFHQIQQQRARDWKHTMLTSATHDTKRGEDYRARLNALSEMPAEWLGMLKHWSRLNRSYHSDRDGEPIPDRNEEIMLYQTLLGSWPNELLDGLLSDENFSPYRTRLKEYLTKALREAKLHSSWAHPDEDYEAGVERFLETMLDRSRANAFLEHFRPHVLHLAQAGVINSLSQVTLKFTLPGVPDLYQGTERWDFSLVDPDNRRPVDYTIREQQLTESNSWSELFEQWRDGRVKQRLIQCLLQLRRNYPDLFSKGSYEPIRLKGLRRHHILAFVRRHKNQRLLVLVPVRVAQFTKGESWPLGEWWGDTHLDLPGASTLWFNAITGETCDHINPSQLFQQIPIAVLIDKTEH